LMAMALLKCIPPSNTMVDEPGWVRIGYFAILAA
jgi:hypothetical protein